MWRRFKDSMNKPFVGLYALYDDGLVYIGHSTDVPKRVKGHDKNINLLNIRRWIA